MDVLVEFEPTPVPRFYALFEMEQQLSDALGRKVDLDTQASLGEYFQAPGIAADHAAA